MNGLVAATLPKATQGSLATRTAFHQVRYPNTQTLLEVGVKEPHGNTLRSSRVPRGHWSNHDAQRDALERYGRERLGMRELDDWYNVSVLDVRNELSFISNYHKDSLFVALKTLYPTHNWDPLKFKSVPRGYWNDENAQRAALERFGRERLGVQQLDDWYKVVATDVTTELSFLAHQYNCSLQVALKKLYPHHNWSDLKFSSAAQGFWKKLNTKQSMKNVLSNMIERYNIKHLNDWYDIPKEDWKIFTKISTSLFGGKAKLLRTWFPHYKWADDLSSSAPERQLRELMQQIRSNITAHPMINGHSIDIYLPNLCLAVEYQGQQHYGQLRFGSFKSTISRDSRKRVELQQQGIQVVSIPYWWKGSWSQIEATLNKHMALVANHS